MPGCSGAVVSAATRASARQFHHRAANGGGEHGLQRLADLRPLHRFGRFAGRRPRSGAGLVVEQRVQRVGECLFVVEIDQHAGTVGEHVARDIDTASRRSGNRRPVRT